MSTLAVEPTVRSTTTITPPPNTNQPGTSEAPTMRVRDLLINDLAGGAAQPPSPDDGFYSAAYFDNVDEEAFLNAQRAAFAEINDAALARAIQESELLAAQRAADEARQRTQAGSGGSSSAASASRARSSTPAPTAPATPSPYALVSPSEFGSQRPDQPRRLSHAYATVSTTQQTSSSSPPIPRSSSPYPKPTSQYYSPAPPASTPAYPSSLSLSTTNSAPSSHNHATPAPNTTIYGPRTHDRQRSSSQSYYLQQNPQHQAKPMMASPSHSRRASSTTIPTTATAVPTNSYRQAAPPPSQPPSTIDPSTFYSNLSKTAPSSRKASVSSSTPPQLPMPPTSSSASRPRTMSSAGSRLPSTAPSGAQSAWYPTRSAAPSGPSVSSHPAPPSMPMPVPVSKSKESAARARVTSVSNASAASTTPTSSSMSARDLRMGVLASIPPSMPSRGPDTKIPATGKPAQHHPLSLGPTARPPPITRPKRRTAKTVPTEVERRAAKAKMFLTSNFGKECQQCGEDVEGPSGSPSVPSEPFSQNLLQQLHVVCSNPACGVTYCRGCFEPAGDCCQPVGPTRSCRGGRGCDIKSCCTYASVVALSHIIDAFDYECVRAAQASGFASPAVSVRSAQAFIDLVISRGDKNTRPFEEVLIRALHAIESWLKVFEERREEYGDDEDDDDDVIDPSKHLLHPLITRSLLPSIFHAFLLNRNVGDWLKHSEIYSLIIEVLKRFVDNGLRKVLDEPIVALLQDDEEGSPTPFHWRLRSAKAEGQGGATSESSSGAEDSAGSNSESDKDTETDATSPDEGSSEDDADDSDDKRRTWVAGGELSSRLNQGARQRSIKALVTKLEEHRGPLMAFGANVKFPATKVKVNNLCDGISYLLLQQVVGWD